MKKNLLLILFLLLGAIPAASQKHTVRLGWGDMMYETAVFHASPSHTFVTPSALPEDFSVREKFGYGYTGHIFAEYLYRAGRNVRLGGMMDFEGIFWKEADFDRNHNVKGAVQNVNNYDLSLIPTVRFDYFNHETVSLYSGLGLGLLMAFDNIGGFELSPVSDFHLIGVEVGRGHWAGAAEFGFMTALSAGNKVYMLGSKLISVSVNYRW
jgi:hypothetical protein